MTIKALMDTTFKTVKNTDSLKSIYQLIYNGKQRFIPVVNKGKLLGAIDATNLNEYILLQAKLSY